MKTTLNRVQNPENQTSFVSTLNNNYALTEAAFENTISRDGHSPNQMNASLDMNSHQILNLPPPGGLNSPLRLQDLSDFVGGTGFFVPPGGSKGQVLTKKTSTSLDFDWRSVKGQEYNLLDYATGNGVTDDFTAITACITNARTNGGTLVITDGTYLHSGTINWGFSNLKVIVLGDNVRFIHTGSGIGHNFNGMLNYPASQGCINGAFGGPGRPLLQGNINTTDLVVVDNWHFGYMKVALREASHNTFRTNDTGLPQVGASAVESIFDIRVTYNIGGAFTTVPFNGLFLNKLAACTFINPIIEGVGNVTSATPGVEMIACVNNIFQGGTVESCFAGGIRMDSACNRNTFHNVHSEANGSAEDWYVDGSQNVFVNCNGAGTTAGSKFRGNYNTISSGNWQSVTVTAGATANKFDGISILNGFTDLGTQTTVIRNSGVAFTSQNYTTEVLGNKLFNTDNQCLLYIASHGLTGVTGTGGNVVVQTSPTLITPNLGTPSTLTLTNATGLPVSTGISGLAASMATFLGTPSSANLKATVTDETGSGALVFATSPALVTPTGIVKGDVGLGNVDNTSDATKNAAVATLTNKTLTTPVINSPTGLIKGDVGLGNVDNTSDATKNSAVATLTNKTLTSPVINTPTGIVKGDVGLGNVDNTSDTTKWAATKTLTNTTYDTAGVGNSLSINGVAATANTGTGSVVRATSPTLVTPVLGTPTSATLTNATGLPISTGVSGLATGVATFLATPTSANLATALTDESGTGVVPFQTTGTWTPADSSGAALTFTAVNAAYTKIGNIVHAYGTLTFPTTASGAVVTISGLPFTVPNSSYATVPSPVKNNVGVGAYVQAIPVANTTTFTLWNNATAAGATNANFTGGKIDFNLTYPAS